ncbi:MAG: hypothetical protein ABEI75_00995 [Halobaculum sp.]
MIGTLTGVATVGTAGCLSVFGGGDSGSDAEVVFTNRTDDELTLTVVVRRPLSWTPEGTAARTEDGFVVVAERELVAEGGEKVSATGLFPSSGSVVFDASLDVVNDYPFLEDDTKVAFRTTSSTVDTPLELTVWYVEDSPTFDYRGELPRKEYYDLELADRTGG